MHKNSRFLIDIYIPNPLFLYRPEGVRFPVLEYTDSITKKFVAVDVKYLSSFNKPVTLEQIKSEKKLSKMLLLRQSRLSVMPIDTKSWNLICKMAKA